MRIFVEDNLRRRRLELSEWAREEGVTSQKESGGERKIKCRLRESQGLGVRQTGTIL